MWDEFCAQQRSEESFGGEAYEGTIRVLIAGTVEGMSREERTTLWMLTLEGNDWRDGKKSADEIPASCDADLVNSLFGRLKSVASEYLNPRIIRYRDQPRD